MITYWEGPSRITLELSILFLYTLFTWNCSCTHTLFIWIFNFVIYVVTIDFVFHYFMWTKKKVVISYCSVKEKHGSATVLTHPIKHATQGMEQKRIFPLTNKQLNIWLQGGTPSTKTLPLTLSLCTTPRPQKKKNEEPSLKQISMLGVLYSYLFQLNMN